MEVLSRAVYRGPNVHARAPVATITVACGRNVDRRVATLPRAFLLRPAETSTEVAAAARRMRTDATAIVPGPLAAIARAVQVAVDAHVPLAAIRPTRAADVRLVLVGYEDPKIGAAALDRAVVLVNDGPLAADGSSARAACRVSPDPASRLVGPERPPGDVAVTMVRTGGGARIVVRSGTLEQPVVTPPPGDPGAALFAAAIAWGLGAPAAGLRP